MRYIVLLLGFLLIIGPIGAVIATMQGIDTLRTSLVPGDPITIVHIPGSATATPGPIGVPTPTIGPGAGNILEQLLAVAKSWLGVPYRWGGCTHQGVDCSCLMVNVFATISVHLPRTTVEQIAVATPISASQARLGDLVFFDNTCSGCGPNPTHVGMVLGGGQMIDAGDPVRIEPIFAGHNPRYGRVLP